MPPPKLRRLSLLVAIVLLMSGLPAAAAECRSTNSDLDNCFILRAPRGLQQAILDTHGLTKQRDLTPSDLEVIVVAGPPTALPENTLSSLRADPDVIEIEPARLQGLSESGAGLLDSAQRYVPALSGFGNHVGAEAAYFAAPVWSGFTRQPATVLMQLYAARDPLDAKSYGAGTVAVIDTGVDPCHPGLRGALVPGYDLLLGQENVIPSEWSALDTATDAQTEPDLRVVADQSYSTLIEGRGTVLYETAASGILLEQSYSTLIEGKDLPSGFGHGTMVAGLIRLVAPGASIMPIRAFDGSGRANLADIIEAIYWAADHGADVINMSFSVGEDSKALRRALMYARRKKVTLVTSAGNNAAEDITYPAAYGEVIGVASTDGQDQLASFTNTGPHVFVAAPGEALVTFYPGNLYAGAWGTSFSSALVAGTAALLHKSTPSNRLLPATPRKAEGAIEKSADALGFTTAGAGRLDVEGAYHVANDDRDEDQ